MSLTTTTNSTIHNIWKQEKRCAIPKVAKASPDPGKAAGWGAVSRTAAHRTKIMLPLCRMHKTPSGPFKAGAALNLDHETMRRARRAEEPLPGLALRCEQGLRRKCGTLWCIRRSGSLMEGDRRAALLQWLQYAECDEMNCTKADDKPPSFRWPAKSLDRKPAELLYVRTCIHRPTRPAGLKQDVTSKRLNGTVSQHLQSSFPTYMFVTDMQSFCCAKSCTSWFLHTENRNKITLRVLVSKTFGNLHKFVGDCCHLLVEHAHDSIYHSDKSKVVAKIRAAVRWLSKWKKHTILFQYAHFIV